MSAEVELLREAAKEMRERARAAPQGSWTARTAYPFTVWQGTEDDPYIVSTNLSCEPAADAEHIASWNPVVALAVADWLDEAAEAAEIDFHGQVTAHPLAVARAFLGRAEQ